MIYIIYIPSHKRSKFKEKKKHESVGLNNDLIFNIKSNHRHHNLKSNVSDQ